MAALEVANKAETKFAAAVKLADQAGEQARKAMALCRCHRGRVAPPLPWLGPEPRVEPPPAALVGAMASMKRSSTPWMGVKVVSLGDAGPSAWW